MKALVKRKAEPGLWLEDVPRPEIGINDVLIKVDRTGICGTDVHIYKWDEWARKTIPVPMVVGHEFVGEIVAVGSNVMTNVWHHDPSIDRDVAAIFDPFGNAVHTALSFPVLGEDVLITGAGPIGVMATAVVRHAGARHVVITDVNPYRLELARKMGGTLAVDVRTETVADAQKKLGMKEGFDVGLEMSGNPAAFRDMLANMCHGGKIAMLGIPEKDMAIDWNLVIFNMLTIKGIYGREMYETWYMMTVMIQSGLDLSPVITHRFHYSDFQKGFDQMLSGQSGKVILNW